jgi:enterochelin esterase family protein
MNVGRLEIFSDCDLVADNRHMKEVLENVGYPIHYAEFSGGHDYIAWQDTLAEGLISLLGQQANDER